MVGCACFSMFPFCSLPEHAEAWTPNKRRVMVWCACFSMFPFCSLPEHAEAWTPNKCPRRTQRRAGGRRSNPPSLHNSNPTFSSFMVADYHATFRKMKPTVGLTRFCCLMNLCEKMQVLVNGNAGFSRFKNSVFLAH
jgi:hypothetical protein